MTFKTFLSILFPLSAISILPACKENAEVDDEHLQNLHYITAYAEASPLDSRSAIDPSKYAEDAVGILWMPDDEIGVYSVSETNVKFANQSSSPQGRTKFAGSLSDMPTYAYYPYTEANAGANVDNLNGTLPLTQTYDPSTGIIQGDWKRGVPRQGAGDEFDFMHLFSLFKISVNATGSALSGETLRKVTMTLPDTRTLGGNFTFNAANGAYNMPHTTDSNTITLEWHGNGTLVPGATLTGYLSCAPDIKADDEIMIEIFTDKRKASFTAHTAYDFEPGMVYSFKLTLTELAEKYDVALEEVGAEPEEETANCYMITSAGTHDFNASVIGNGAKGIIAGAGFHTEDPRINPKSAKLLWEDTNGFVTDVTLKKGRVHYNTTSNLGNAVIAVYSGDNATGDILWSWHIWGVGPNLPLDYEISTKGGHRFSIMDRSIGALPSTDAQRLSTTRVEDEEKAVISSMLYQWGRKDPIPNGEVYYVDGVETDIASSYPLYEPAGQDESTIAASILNPDKMIKNGASADWLGADIELLWGDAKFSGNADNGRWTNVKTIYDPSPVGYRVPSYYTYTDFMANNSTSYQLKGVMSMSENVPTLSTILNCVISVEKSGSTDRYLPKGIHMSSIGKDVTGSNPMFGYGIYFKRDASDSVGNFFAQSGYRSGLNGSRQNYGISSYYWLSCGNVTNTSDKAVLNIGWFAWRTSAYNTGVDKGLPQGNAGVVGKINVQDFTSARNAAAVRCVRE